ncbi:MAG: hypothetical protein GY711_11565 [bacterium]|nr:hypothetical protein [bacterium]
MSPTHRPRLPILLLAGVLAAGCTATRRYDPPGQAASYDRSFERLAAEIAEAAALRTTLSSMRVAVHELTGKDRKETYGPVARARAVELSSLGIALQHELVAALSEHLYVLDPTSSDEGDDAQATHTVEGHFVRLDGDLSVTLRLVDSASSVIVASARGHVPLDPLIEQGALVWATDSPTTRLDTSRPVSLRRVESTRPSTPGPAGPSRSRRIEPRTTTSPALDLGEPGVTTARATRVPAQVPTQVPEPESATERVAAATPPDRDATPSPAPTEAAAETTAARTAAATAPGPASIRLRQLAGRDRD